MTPCVNAAGAPNILGIKQIKKSVSVIAAAEQVSRRNIVSVVASAGRSLQARAATTGNARSPSVHRRVEGSNSMDKLHE